MQAGCVDLSCTGAPASWLRRPVLLDLHCFVFSEFFLYVLTWWHPLEHTYVISFPFRVIYISPNFVLLTSTTCANGGAFTKEESLRSRRHRRLARRPHRRYGTHAQAIASRIHTCIHNALCSCLDPSCILAEPSECWSWPDGCNLHLSGAYKGPCWPWKDDDCNRVCLGENSNNFSGACYSFQCWCYTKCDP